MVLQTSIQLRNPRHLYKVREGKSNLMKMVEDYGSDVDSARGEFEQGCFPLESSGPRAVKELIGELRESLTPEVGCYG